MTTDFKRPESVLVVVFTKGAEVLLLQRQQPEDFWQSVTGSMRWDEAEPMQAAVRELHEETGIDSNAIIDYRKTNRFPILPQWRQRYAPEVSENQEHVFGLELEDRCDVVLNPKEHRDYVWLPARDAMDLASSWTNRDAIADIVIAR